MVHEPTTTHEQPTGEAGEPKTDLDRRGQLVARLASILYLGTARAPGVQVRCSEDLSLSGLTRACRACVCACAEKLKQDSRGGGGRADGGQGEGERDTGKSEAERERRQCLKALLSHILDDNCDERVRYHSWARISTIHSCARARSHLHCVHACVALSWPLAERGTARAKGRGVLSRCQAPAPDVLP
jgi:hypothetical protein